MGVTRRYVDGWNGNLEFAKLQRKQQTAGTIFLMFFFQTLITFSQQTVVPSNEPRQVAGWNMLIACVLYSGVGVSGDRTTTTNNNNEER